MVAAASIHSFTLPFLLLRYGNIMKVDVWTAHLLVDTLFAMCMYVLVRLLYAKNKRVVLEM